MVHRTFAVVALVVVVTLAGGSAFADAYQDGKKLYKSRNYSGALAKFKQAVKDRPTQAKVRWMLGLTYLKLRNGPAALSALREAKRLDPGIGFTKASKYNDKVAKAKSLGGSSRKLTTTAGSALSARAAYNRALSDLRRSTNLFKDYSGRIKAASASRISSVVRQAARRGINMRVVVLPKGRSRNLRGLIQRAWGAIRGGTRDAIIAATPTARNAKAGFIRSSDMQRVLQRNIGRSIANLASDVYRIGARKFARAAARSRAAFGGAPMRKKKSRVWMWVLIAVGGILLIIIIVAIVRARQRRAEEEAAYRESYESAINLVGEVGNKLTDLQLSVQIIDDEDATMLVRRGEANYFAAQTLMGKLPKPGDGDPEVERGRRLLGMLHEANEALEKAEMIVNRLTHGKPVNKDKIMEEGGKKLGCFFCSRPLRDESAGKVTPVEFKGQKMDVLICMPCYNDYTAGKQPKVRMVEYEGRNVHWTMVPDYDPWYDYYHYDRYHATWVDVVAMSLIFDWGMWGSYHSPYVTWYEPGYYHYDYEPTYYNIDTLSTDSDVDAVIGSAWSGDTVPSGVDYGDAGVDFGGGESDFVGGGESDFGGGGESDFGGGESDFADVS